VPTIDEDHSQANPPVRCHGIATRHNRDNGLPQICRDDIAPKLAKAVELPVCVDQRFIVVTFPGLMLL
jgi:hypothetical protein